MFLFVWTSELQFWQPQFFWTVKRVSAESQQKIEVQELFEYKLPNTLAKVYFIEKEFHSLKFLSINAKCSSSRHVERSS